MTTQTLMRPSGPTEAHTGSDGCTATEESGGDGAGAGNDGATEEAEKGRGAGTDDRGILRSDLCPPVTLQIELYPAYLTAFSGSLTSVTTALTMTAPAWRAKRSMVRFGAEMSMRALFDHGLVGISSAMARSVVQKDPRRANGDREVVVDDDKGEAWWLPL